MKKLFCKHETFFCILLIVLYLVVNSYCIQNFGIDDYRSAIINTVFSFLLFALVVVLGRIEFYGLTKVREFKKYLYFIPLLLIVSVNLWNGININNTTSEIIFYIITMLNVGFIEEVIFRGFLFKMMEKDNAKIAIAVSSVTFGIGHIVNLLNGAEFIPTLMQICYAMAIGYLFVIIFHRSKSLIPCIIAHGVNNALSIFNVENELSTYIVPIFLTIVPLIYAAYINKKEKSEATTVPEKKNESTTDTAVPEKKKDPSTDSEHVPEKKKESSAESSAPQKKSVKNESKANETHSKEPAKGQKNPVF